MDDIEVVSGQNFDQHQTIILDGKHFDECTFNGTTLFYGGGLFSAKDCKFIGCGMKWYGAAQNTIRVMRMIGMIHNLPATFDASGTIH